MEPMQMVLLGVVAPGAAALGVIGLWLALARARGTPLREALARATPVAGLALAAGYGLTFVLLLGWPELLPIDVTRVGPWVALAAVPLGFVPGRAARAAAVGALGLGVGVYLAAPAHAGGALVAHAALVAATFVVLELGLTRVVAATEPRGGAIAVIVLLSGGAAALLFADTASLAQALGGLAAAAGALMTAGFVGRGQADLRRATPVIAAVLATNLHAVTLYASGTYPVLALLALAPLVLGLALAWLGARPGRVFALVVPAALMALPIGAAGAIAATRYFGSGASAPAAGVDGAAGTGTGAADEATDPDYGY